MVCYFGHSNRPLSSKHSWLTKIILRCSFIEFHEICVWKFSHWSVSHSKIFHLNVIVSKNIFLRERLSFNFSYIVLLFLFQLDFQGTIRWSVLVCGWVKPICWWFDHVTRDGILFHCLKMLNFYLGVDRSTARHSANNLTKIIHFHPVLLEKGDIYRMN